MNHTTRTYEVCADTIVYRDVKKHELTNDYILPDYLADVKSILCIKPVIHRNSSLVTNSKVEYDGELTFDVLFITEDDKIRSVLFEGAYDGSISIEEINDENCTAIIMPCIDNLNYKLNNPRKLNIKTMLNLDITVLCHRCITPRIIGTHTLEDEMSLEQLEHDFDFIKCNVLEEKNMAVSEEILLEASNPNINEILSCTMDASITDLRCIEQKLSYRGEIAVTCLYTNTDEDNNERYYTACKKIPMEGILDVGVNLSKDQCRWKLITGQPKAIAKNDEFEQKRIIEIDFTYDLQLICFTNETARSVTDAYSVDCHYKTNLASLDVITENHQISGNVSINETLPVKEHQEEATGEIILASASLENVNTAFNSQNGRILCNGDITFALCVQIGDGTPKALSFTRPFRFEADCGHINEPQRITADVFVIKLKCRYDSSNYYADTELGYMISSEKCGIEKTLESIELNSTENKPAKGGTYPITLYYPKMNESLWNIAKEYNTTVKAIRAANGMTDENMDNIKALIIPRGGVKPLYAKQI